MKLHDVLDHHILIDAVVILSRVKPQCTIHEVALAVFPLVAQQGSGESVFILTANLLQYDDGLVDLRAILLTDGGRFWLWDYLEKFFHNVCYLIANINVLDYDYTDTEINISKEDAIRIFKENGIDVSEDEIELSIENVGRTEYEEGNKLFEEISEEQMKDLELYEIKSDVRKVWRYEDTQNIQYYVDTIDGKVIIPQKFSIEKQE